MPHGVFVQVVAPTPPARVGTLWVIGTKCPQSDSFLVPFLPLDMKHRSPSDVNPYGLCAASTNAIDLRLEVTRRGISG